METQQFIRPIYRRHRTTGQVEDLRKQLLVKSVLRHVESILARDPIVQRQKLGKVETPQGTFEDVQVTTMTLPLSDTKKVDQPSDSYSAECISNCLIQSNDESYHSNNDSNQSTSQTNFKMQLNKYVNDGRNGRNTIQPLPSDSVVIEIAICA